MNRLELPREKLQERQGFAARWDAPQSGGGRQTEEVESVIAAVARNELVLVVPPCVRHGVAAGSLQKQDGVLQTSDHKQCVDF